MGIADGLTWIRKAASLLRRQVLQVYAPVSIIANTRGAEPHSALAAIGSNKANWIGLIVLG